MICHLLHDRVQLGLVLLNGGGGLEGEVAGRVDRGGAGRHQLSNLTDGTGRGGAGLVLARPLPPLHSASVHDPLDLQRLGRLEEDL